MSGLGRFISADILGGHTEDPQTLNRYGYVRNSPTRFTDPTGRDFYLGCSSASSSCHEQAIGVDKNGNGILALVQGVTDSKGNFTPTQIANGTNNSLTDVKTNTGSYTGKVDTTGVFFSRDGGKTSSPGIFVGTNPTVVQGTGKLMGFTFTFMNGKPEANQTAAGRFVFSGTPEQAGRALDNAGFTARPGSNAGYNEYRSSGEFPLGGNSGHFNVLQVSPPLSQESSGDVHFGEHNPFYSPAAAVAHCVSDGACE